LYPLYPTVPFLPFRHQISAIALLLYSFAYDRPNGFAYFGQACNCLVFQFFHYRLIIIIIIIIIIITLSSCPSQVVYQITTNKTFLHHNRITFSCCYYMCTVTSYFGCGLISRTRYLDDMNTDESATSFHYVLIRSSS
jgi:hypothetical protein